MRQVIILATYLFLIPFFVGGQSAMPVITESSQLEQHIGKEVVIKGIMQMKKFINKGGVPMEYYEFWVVLADGKNILLRNNTGSALSKEPFTHKVHLTGRLFYGNMDSDDPKVQSRVGYRLDFTAWKIVERR
jgi:hypothetical protein